LLVIFLGITGCGVGVSDYNDAVLEGVSNMNSNKPEKALKHFNRAIEIDPKRAGGYLGRANALNTIGKYAEAVKNYNTAISIDDTIANAYINRAIAYSHLGKFKKAIADYEKGLTLDPEIDDAPGFLDRMFSDEPNRDKGIRKHLEQLKKKVKS